MLRVMNRKESQNECISLRSNILEVHCPTKMAFVNAVPVNVRKSPISFRNTTTNTRPLCMKQKQWVTPKVPRVTVKNPGIPEGRSSVFFNYMRSKAVRDFGGATKKADSKGAVQDALNAASTPYFLAYASEYKAGYGSGGNARSKLHKPFIRNVDDYIAQCARRQYIAAQNNSGVYNTSCTESTVSGGAEESRIASLAASFRTRQVKGPVSFADYYETRRFATALAQGCNYEESLVGRFPAAASMTVLGTMEKEGACVRYAIAGSEAEKYMQSCVERAASTRATPNGEYNILCQDGTVKGSAESKRVAGLATKYRNGFMGPLAKLAMQYNQKKFARDYYSKGCAYENDLFTKYPAVAAAMRPDYARY